MSGFTASGPHLVMLDAALRLSEHRRPPPGA
jgi:hypothetical protein